MNPTILITTMLELWLGLLGIGYGAPIELRSVVALGDSLTYGNLNPGPSWPVAVDAAVPEWTLAHNAGVVGDTTLDMQKRLERDVYAYAPRIVFVLGGVNDLAHTSRTPEQIARTLKAIAADICHHGSVPILMTVPHNNVKAIQPGIARLNRLILASEWTVVSLSAITARNTVDGVHWNPSGVRLAVKAVLASKQEIQKSKC